jgi:hypothetical protein
MLIFKPSKDIYGNTIEMHYWFDDESHTMDAFIENRCEYEILGLIAEVGKLLDYDISIDTEAITEGGLRRWLQVVGKQENKEGTITTAVITAIVILILITPLTEITENLIDKWFEDKELTELQKEKLRLEVRKLKRDELKELAALDTNYVIKKKRSNFYEKLEKVEKIEKVSFKIWDDKKENDSDEKEVPKHKFKAYILSSDEIEPLEDESAVIEIISPVLKKGNYKWSGYYKGEIIKFAMKSKEFKDLVQAGQIPFVNGSSIDCNLIIKRKIDVEGIVINSSYVVTRVNKYFESDKPIETREGKKHRMTKEAKERYKQMNLFAEEPNEPK